MSQLTGVRSLLIAMAVFSASCDKKTPPSSGRAPAPTLTDPPTEAEALQFGKDLENAARERNSEGVEAVVRMREFQLRLMRESGASDQDLKGFDRIFREGIQGGGFRNGLIREIENGGNYKFLRIHVVDGRQRALFRIVGNDGSANYHDYILSRFPDGKIGMQDVYLYSDGETLAQSMRWRHAAMFAKHSGKAISDAERVFLDHASEVAAMSRALASSKFDEARQKFELLPQSVQDDKTVLLLYLRGISRNVGAEQDEYLKRIDKLRLLFPADPCIEYCSIEYFRTKKEYEQALRAIDSFAKRVGGDSFLKSWRADILIDCKRYDEARQYIDSALKDEPDLENAYWLRISLSLHENKYAETLDCLKKIATTFKAHDIDFSQDPEFDDFRKSPQYGEWEKWYAEYKKK
jgi:tetratricopeptide (TPR) repeat protein